MNEITPTTQTEFQLPISVVDKVRRYVRASRSDATVRSYRASARTFAAWCEAHGRIALPASVGTVGAFLADNAERLKPATLGKILCGVAHAHRLAGHAFDWSAADPHSSDPADQVPVADVLAGIRREHGIAQRRVDALKAEELARIVAALPNNLQGLRDRAMLLLGFAGALRRSELVGIDVGEQAEGSTGRIDFVAEGIRLVVEVSKADQEGAGIPKGIPRAGGPLCPVAAVEAWMAAAGITNGPLFRPITKGGRIGAPVPTARTADRLSDRAVAEIVKRAAARVGGEARAERVSGHSLRAGFATSAAAANITGENMARHVGWKSSQMATRYIREAELFSNNPLHKIFKETNQ